MKESSFAGMIARQFRRINQNVAVQATRKFFHRIIGSFQESQEEQNPPRALRYELCEARYVLDGYPFAPGGDDGEGFEEEVGIPVFVDGNFEFADQNAQFPYGRDNTFLLESNPSATKTIYLDFDGHHSVNNWWNHNIVFPAFDRDGNVNSFSDNELREIQLQFLHVVEDFIGFNVNVTTKDPGVEALRRTSASDQTWGVRAVNTQYTNGFGNGTGGIAHLNSFDANIDDPVFTFNKGHNAGGMTNSHEVGHALGLRHDGLGGSTYHPGTGNGPTGWGPIMGAPFGKNLVQWSNGDYPNSTNNEDDFSVITRQRNGFGFRDDDHGNDFGSATPINPGNDEQVSGWGIIERNTDLDYFSFNSGPGNISIDVKAVQSNASLDIEAKLYSANGTLIATSNPANGLNAVFNENVSGGTYFITVDGTGKPGVYSDYGSVGYFEISGTVVDPVNDPPTLNPLDDMVLDEDAPEQTVVLFGITAGQNESQPLAVTASSNNPALIPNPTVGYTSPDVTGNIKFKPAAGRNGTATISVTVEDGGLDMDLSTKGDNATFTRTFEVVVNPVNDPPTLDPLDGMIINEDADEQVVDLTGITDGDEGLQPLKVTAVSTNPGLIPNPNIEYTSPNSSGKLKYKPVADQFGTTTIFVTVEDGGDDNNLATTADNLTFTRSFIVRVNPVNDPPTLSAIPNQSLDEDESRSLTLTGITAGGGETQPLAVSATSSNQAIMEDPVVDYTSDDSTGTIHLVPKPNATGSTTITVTVEDGGLDEDLSTTADNATYTRVFVVDVNAVNDTPTLNPIDDVDLMEDDGEQAVPLIGISAGGSESQPLNVTATSSNTALISNQTVDYTSANTTGILNFSPNPDRYGTSVITVTVEDGGLDGDLSTKGDNATFSQQFVVTVDPVNDAPRFDVPAEVHADRSKGLDEVRIIAIDGGPFENQPLQFTVSTDNPNFLTNLQVDHTDPNRTGKVTFDTLNQLGRGTIFLTLEDGGLDGDLSTTADNATTTKEIVVMVSEKRTSYADTDHTAFGLVSGVYNDTYWRNSASQSITEVGFSHGNRSRLDHRWLFKLAGSNVSFEFLVFAGHNASNEQFNFEYKVAGTSTWKSLVTTNRNSPSKYHARVSDPDLADGGNLWVRVRDTNRTNGDTERATLTVAKMFVVSRGIEEIQHSVNGFVFDGVGKEQGNDKAQIRFQLADRQRLAHDVDVYYQVGGTASNGDYREILTGKKTIRAGNLMTRLFITPKDDRLMEGNESLTVTILNDAGYRITGSNTSTVKIIDNDKTTYEANAEVSYLGKHTVNYSQSNFNDSQYEIISERLYHNRTMLNHQWKFDVSGESDLIIKGKFEVMENSFVDDFFVAWSPDQRSWRGLGRVAYGQPLDLNRAISLPPGTQDVWVRIVDRYRRPHDTHVAKVAVSYLQLEKQNAVGGALLAGDLQSFSSSAQSPSQFAAATPVAPGLVGHTESNLPTSTESEFVLPEVYTGEDRDEVDSVFEELGS